MKIVRRNRYDGTGRGPVTLLGSISETLIAGKMPCSAPVADCALPR